MDIERAGSGEGDRVGEGHWTLLPAVVVRSAAFPWESVLSLAYTRAARAAESVVHLERQALHLLATPPLPDPRPDTPPTAPAGGSRPGAETPDATAPRPGEDAPDAVMPGVTSRPGADAPPGAVPGGISRPGVHVPPGGGAGGDPPPVPQGGGALSGGGWDADVRAAAAAAPVGARGGRLLRAVRGRLRDLRPLPPDTPGSGDWLADWNRVTHLLEEARVTLAGAVGEDAAAVRAAVAAMVADERLLDALVCSSPGLYRELRHGAKGGTIRRQLASRVQRLAAAPGTANCFGPVGYAAVVPGAVLGHVWDGPYACPRRVAFPAARVVEAMQQRVLADPVLVSGLVPRRKTWAGEVPDGAAFVACCDGRRTVAEIAAETGIGLERAAAALAVAVRRGLLVHDLCPPATVCDPLGWLRDRLAARALPPHPRQEIGAAAATDTAGPDDGRLAGAAGCDAAVVEVSGQPGEREVADTSRPDGGRLGEAGGCVGDAAEVSGQARAGARDRGTAGLSGGFGGVEGGAGPGGPGIADAPEFGVQEAGRDEAGRAWEAPELVSGAVEVPAQRRPVAAVRTAAEPSVGRRVSEISELLEQYPGASPDVKLAVQRRVEALTGGGPGDGRVVVHEAAAGTLRVTAGGALAADLRDRVPRVLDLLAGEADLTRRLTNRLVAGRLGPGTFALAEAQRTTAGLDVEHGGRLTGRLACLIRDAPDGEAVLDLAALLDDPDPPAAPVLCSADLLVAASSLEAYEAGVTPLVLGGLHDTVLLTPWSLQFHEEAAECLAERDAAVRRALSGFTVLNVVPHRSEGAPPPQLPGPVLELGGVAADPRRRIGLDELYVHSDGRRAVLNAKGVEEPLLFHNGEHVTALHTALALPMIRLPRLPDLPHVPRLTWGNIVISRRRWRLGRASFEGLGQAAGDVELLVAMARLRESHGLPVTFFAASPRRRRPFYVDTRSPALVEALGRLAATAERLTLTEVSPGPEECWLRDGEQRFAAELRCVYLRSAAGAHAETRPAIPSTPPHPSAPPPRRVP